MTVAPEAGNCALRIGLIACALAALACASAGDRVEQVFFSEYLALSFDRPSDLIPPEGLRVTSTEERQIALAWEPVLVGDVAGYAITRARGSAAEHALVGYTKSRFESVYIDQGPAPGVLGDGQTYSYRVHPFDSLGRVSRSHAHLTATTEARPPTPGGLRTYSNLPRKVALAWDPSPSRSVVGYRIYRSPTLSGQWTEVGFAQGRMNTVWEDPVNGDLRLMYYRIDAVNGFGAASDPTGGVRAVTKAEPLPPIGLAVRRSRLGMIELEWQGNVERDLERYEIWRADALEGVGAAGFGPERQIGRVEATSSQFMDPTVGCGQAVRYRIRAADRDRLMSGFSQPLDSRGDTMELALGTDSAGRPELAWDPELVKLWPNARIAESRAALPDRVIGMAENTSRYSLAALTPGAHELKVTLLDIPAGPDESPRESPTCALRVEIPASAPGSP
jgi:fibronectin type 3 domain-containing protein